MVLALGALLILARVTAQPDSAESGESELYRLKAGDSVKMTVFEEPELQVEQKLDSDGVIVVPLLGRVSLVGLTLREAETFLEGKFVEEDYLLHPQVTVSILQHAEQVFYIFGEVNNPGAKQVPPGRQSVDILEAISLAGDLSQYAKRTNIILRRAIPETGEEKKIIIDLEKVLKGDKGGESDLVQVMPQDIIYVPERLF